MSDTTFDDNQPIGYVSALNTFYTYSYVNNGQFYSLVPAPYYDYYQRFIRPYFYWYDGFVPYFHSPQSGMFSTRLAYTVLKKLAEQTTAGQLMFNDDGVTDKNILTHHGKKYNSLEWVEHWSKDFGFDNKVTQGVEWSFVGGDSLIKLDSNGKDLRPTILRKDNYFIDVDFAGRITNYTGLLYTYNKTVPSQTGKAEMNYYLMEERKYNEKTEEPEIRLFVKMGMGNLVTNKTVDIRPESVPFESIPRDIRHSIMRDYPKNIIGKWGSLPLKTLGVYLIKASENVSFMPSLPFGESLLSNNIHILMSYDYYYSALNTNMYTSRSKLIMPQHMQTPDAVSNQYSRNHNSGFDSYIMTQVPYSNPETAKPIVLQFDLRADSWEKIRNILLQTMSTNLGISERTIAAYLVPAAEKPTAREISSDENSTALFVENKRRLIKQAINPMLEDLLEFYNFKDEKVTVKFSKMGLTNISNLVQMVTVLKQNGLIDDKTAMEMVFVDKNNLQIEQMLSKIEKAKEEELARTMKENEQVKSIEDKVKEENNTDISQVKKPKKGLFGRAGKE